MQRRGPKLIVRSVSPDIDCAFRSITQMLSRQVAIEFDRRFALRNDVRRFTPPLLIMKAESMRSSR